MKNKIKKLSILMIAALAIMTSLLRFGGLTVYADSDFTFDGTTLTAYNGSASSVVIPEGTVAIGANAFWGKSGVTSITLPSTLTTLKSNAFAGTSISKIELPKAIDSISAFAFDNCSKLQNIYLYESGNTKFATFGGVLYNKGGTTILRYPQGRTSTSYFIRSDVTTVGNSAFYNCLSLTSVTIPDNVKTISAYAFSGCRSLKSVTVPATVDTVGDRAFADCPALTTMNIKSRRPGTLHEDALKDTTGVITVNYDGTTDDWNMSRWKPLFGSDTTVKCGFTITNSEFSRYTGVGGTVTIPSGITKIGIRAFADKTAVTSVVIPESVTTIDYYAFTNTSVTSLYIPSSVTNIGNFAFDGMTKLESIGVSSSNTKFSSSGGVLFTKDGTLLKRYPPAKSGTSYTVPSTVTSIGSSSFSQCKNLNSVTLPDSLTTIYGYAFKACTALVSVTIPEKVTQVSADSFAGCTSLRTVTIKAPKATCAEDAFRGDGTLTTVYFEGTSSDWTSSSWKNAVQTANSNATVNIAFVIENDVLKSYQGTCSKVKIPSGVTSIGTSAFSGKTSVTFVSIPDSVTTINNYAFKGTSITSIILPKSVTSIFSYAFDGMTKLNSISVDSANTAFSSSGGVLFNKAGTELRRYPQAKTGASFTVPSGVKYIGNSAFYDCAKLTAITIPENVKTIGSYSFGKCIGLKSVTIPSSISSVGSYAFSDSAALKTLYIKAVSPSTVKSDAFSGCSGLATVNYDGTKSQWNASKWKDAIGSGVSVVYAYSHPVITKQPVNKTLTAGSSLTLSVEAEGRTALRYQWYFKKKGQSSFSLWSGRTHASETVTPNLSWNGMQLYCNISDASNQQVDSNIITVTVNPLPLAITTQPADKTIQLGESVTLSLKATGSELQYQWYYKKKGQTSFSVWKNRTHASETVTPNLSWNGIQLYCKVTDGTGKSVNSDTVTVIVKSVPVITTQPTNQSITLGESVTLSLKATGSELKYQWYYKKKGQTSFSVWKNRTHASETVTPNDTWNGIQLYCRVTDDDGDTVDSDTVTVTVALPIKITQQPKSQTINLGDTITLSLKATGSGLKYQWYFKKSGQSTFSVWNGRTHATETVTPNATWNGIQLYCKVTDSIGKSVDSDIITVRIR